MPAADACNAASSSSSRLCCSCSRLQFHLCNLSCFCAQVLAAAFAACWLLLLFCSWLCSIPTGRLGQQQRWPSHVDVISNTTSDSSGTSNAQQLPGAVRAGLTACISCASTDQAASTITGELAIQQGMVVLLLPTCC